jgi:hypothetical protein
MQYIDLQPFEDFIRQRNLIDDRYLSFYLNWVLRFLRSEFPSETRSSQDLLQKMVRVPALVNPHIASFSPLRKRGPLDSWKDDFWLGLEKKRLIRRVLARFLGSWLTMGGIYPLFWWGSMAECEKGRVLSVSI